MKRFYLLLLALGALTSESAAGQDGWGVGILPRAGLLSPDTYFYEVFANFSGDGPVEWSTGSLGRSFTAGLGLELRAPGDRYRIRAEVYRSFDTWLLVSHSLVVPRDFFDPPEVRTSWLDVPSNLTVTSLQLVLPTRLRLGPISPYFMAGFGGKFYEFGDPTEPNDVGATLPEEGFTWGADGGVGITVEVMWLDVDIQLRDAVSRYWGKTQHDLFVTGGFVVQLQ